MYFFFLFLCHLLIILLKSSFIENEAKDMSNVGQIIA